MKKSLIVGTAALVTALLVGGIFNPNSMLMWFASTSFELTLVRGAILVALALLFFTDPPRGMGFRASILMFAAFLGVVAISSMQAFYVGVVDSIVFVQVAILLAIEGLEVGPAAAKQQKEAPDDVAVVYRKAIAALPKLNLGR